MKTCAICGQQKPISAYSRHPNTRDRLSPNCKPCNAADIRLAKLARRDPTVREHYERVLRERHIARFWRLVNKDAPAGCWEWQGRKRNGYGRLQRDGKMLSAHRFAYELVGGPIPAGDTLDHLCRNRACVNPAHLEPVPMKVNTLRGVGPTAANGEKTACPKGHPYDAENTRIEKYGSRRCRTCERARHRRDRERRRAMA